jgi:hypothetical protein
MVTFNKLTLFFAPFIMLFLFAGCTKDPVEPENNPSTNGTGGSSSNISIGDFHEGGIVFWIDPTDNTKGLVCALVDQSAAAEWGCYGDDSFHAYGINIGTGMQNTLNIVNGCSQQGIGAKLCYNLVHNGYSDWFLGSNQEMYELGASLSTINSSLTANGGTAISGDYWTSTESGGTGGEFYAQALSTSTGFVSSVYRTSTFAIRAIREF